MAQMPLAPNPDRSAAPQQLPTPAHRRVPIPMAALIRHLRRQLAETAAPVAPALAVAQVQPVAARVEPAVAQAAERAKAADDRHRRLLCELTLSKSLTVRAHQRLDAIFQ